MRSTVIIKLKQKHEDTVISRLIDEKIKLDYVKMTLRTCKMERWEKKEYESIREGLKVNMRRYKMYIRNNAEVFNKILAE